MQHNACDGCSVQVPAWTLAKWHCVAVILLQGLRRVRKFERECVQTYTNCTLMALKPSSLMRCTCHRCWARA